VRPPAPPGPQDTQTQKWHGQGYNNPMPEVMRLKSDEAPLVLERCRDILARGGLVILPTDTVYGIAARADMRGAVKRIYEIKRREREKALVVMVSTLEEAALITAPAQREILAKVGSLWPGPLTLVVRAGDVPWKSVVAPAAGTVGIRVPDSPFMLRLLRMTGPLAVTSANPSGGKAPAYFGAVDDQLLSRVELAVDGGAGGSGRPSTVAEIKDGWIKILRPGDIDPREIQRAMEGG